MSITKQYSQDKTVCKVTFTLPKTMAEQFTTIAVLGDFNNWDPKANHFTVMAHGDCAASVELETNKEYQFRYLGDGDVWLNESEADKIVPGPYGGSDNSVIVV